MNAHDGCICSTITNRLFGTVPCSVRDIMQIEVSFVTSTMMQLQKQFSNSDGNINNWFLESQLPDFQHVFVAITSCVGMVNMIIWIKWLHICIWTHTTKKNTNDPILGLSNLKHLSFHSNSIPTGSRLVYIGSKGEPRRSCRSRGFLQVAWRGLWTRNTLHFKVTRGDF